jgi:hypothetical protein
VECCVEAEQASVLENPAPAAACVLPAPTAFASVLDRDTTAKIDELLLTLGGPPDSVQRWYADSFR